LRILKNTELTNHSIDDEKEIIDYHKLELLGQGEISDVYRYSLKLPLLIILSSPLQFLVLLT